jgi:PA14 domain
VQKGLRGRASLVGHASDPQDGTLAATRLSWSLILHHCANQTLSGTAAGKRCEAAVDYAWGLDGPTGVGVGTDNFSARWVKTQNFAAGTHTITATADDGICVYVDGTLVIDRWKDQSVTTYTASRQMTAGNHEVKVEYCENGGDAVAKVVIAP